MATKTETPALQPKPNVTDSQDPKTNIARFVDRYRLSYRAFEAAADYVESVCRAALSAGGFLGHVSSRAKDPDRLNTKLYQRMSEAKYTSLKAVEDDIVDLIGARIILYQPTQEDEVVSKLESLFVTSKPVPKQTPKDPVTAGKLLQTLLKDDTMLALDEAPKLTFPKDKTLPEYGSYRATHVRFTLKKYELGTEFAGILDGQELKVEIQVQSLLMNAWSEVSHDLLYKTMNGQLSSEEYRLLDCLNGIGRLGELVLSKFRRTMDMRLQPVGDAFPSSFELAECIRNYVNPKFSVKYNLGDADDFLDFLNLVNCNSKATVMKALEKVSWTDTTVTYNTVINNLFDLMLSSAYVQPESTSINLKEPFLLKSQNATLPAVDAAWEVLAIVADVASRPIMYGTMAQREDRTEFRMLPTELITKYNALVTDGLYVTKDPVMPKVPRPLNLNVLAQPKTQAKLLDLLEMFNKYGPLVPAVRYNTRLARIRVWKIYQDRILKKPSSK